LYRFQWVFCQLKTLRHAVQPDVRAILEKLPKTLDETYERVLKDINENNREHARRLLHCLAASVRPLRVEELAEILTFDFDTAEGGIPKFHADRRPKDPEEAVLSICSSLIVIVDNRGSRVVQFSHLSVKDFLTSNHLASSTRDLTLYDILPGPAHTILVQACLGLLLHLDGHNDKKSVKGSPLAEYAARHWVAHAQFEDVASRVEDGMKSLFDLDKPHFASWIGLYDMDGGSGGKLPSEIPSPLYYSALCGLHDLVPHLAIKYPQHVNAVGGFFSFPLVAALCRNHFRVAGLLLEHGGSVDVRDTRKQTALHKTIDRHDKVAIDAVQFLLGHGADVNAKLDDLWTPLHLAVNIGELSVTRMLLEHQADVNSRNDDGQAPLHLLSRRETSQEQDDDGSDIARLLLERGPDVNEKDKDNATPLHLASYNKRLKIVQVLLDHGANANAEKDQGETPLQILLKGNHNAHEDGIGVARLLLEHGAEAYARDKYHMSTSDLACCFGREKIWRVLLGDGETFKPENNRDQNVFRLWIEGEYCSQEHSLGVSHIFPRVRRGWECARQVRHNPAGFRIIPWKARDGTNIT
jgi:ankyrin repeat protein